MDYGVTAALGPRLRASQQAPSADAGSDAESRTLAARPFLKWVGGKGRLLGELAKLLPAGARALRHVEPFAGGAALFFACAGSRALLSDVNRHLMHTYRAVRDDVDDVVVHLAELAAQHSSPTYYATRERFNAGRLNGAEAAAAFIYLNKSCFNGLYRVNRSGEFNVPIGRYASPRILDESGLRAASAKLQGAELRVGGFEAVLEHVRSGDFVYLDPPYVPSSRTASFAAYAAGGFHEQDHERLRDVFVELAQRDVPALLSNSDTRLVRELYRGWVITEVFMGRSVNCVSGRRGMVRELLIRNF